MLSMFNSIVEPKVVDLAKDILKPQSLIADSSWLQWFKQEYSVKNNVEFVSITSEGRALTACKIQLNASKEASSLKIAIVYICGNGEFTACSLPLLEPLLNDIMAEGYKVNNHVEYTVFCQDYRGKGFNQKDGKENFNHYPLLQDAKDQASLIKKLLDEGFFPENIFMIGHSLGSAVSLWAIDILINDFKLDCKQIKIYSDRGYGNLLDFPFVKPFLSNQEKTHNKLKNNGMMPALSLHDIAVSLPNSFVYRAENDGVIPESISLTSTFKQNEIYGRNWTGEAKAGQKENPHNIPFSDLQLAVIPELKPQHFMTAIIHQSAIKLNFDFKLPSCSGYALSKNAKIGNRDFIEIPKCKQLDKSPITDYKKSEPNDKCVTVHIDGTLISELDRYIRNRSEEAIKSGYGGAHKKGLLGWTGWSAKEQVQTALRLMVALGDGQEPNVEAVNAMKSENGPHKSGELNIIYEKIVQLASDLEKLQFFNQWITSMPEQRKKIETKKVSTSQSMKIENGYSRFFRPSLIGLGVVVGSWITCGLGGAAIGAFVGYLAPEAAETMRDRCKKV